MIEAPSTVPAAGARLPRGQRLRRGLAENPLMVAGGVMSVLILLVALLAPLLAPFPADAGSATHPFMVLRAPSAQHWFGTDNVGRDVYSRVLYGARISPLIALVVLVLACAIGVPLGIAAGFFGGWVDEAIMRGTDNVGRDVYSRVLYGARISPLIALVVLVLACAIGVPLGIAAGFFGGWVDEAIMRVTDIFLAFPSLLLALALAEVLPPSLITLTIAIAVTWWPWYTRLIRGQAASVAGRPYVESCRALGISRTWIIFRHILPNSITPLIVQVSLDVGGVILTVSALSFLGLGAQDPTPDWGLMVAEGQNYFMTGWWVVTFPGLAILVTAFAFTLLGDGLRDLLDPKRIFLR